MADDESMAEGLWRTVRRGVLMEDLDGEPDCPECGSRMRRAGRGRWECGYCGNEEAGR